MTSNLAGLFLIDSTRTLLFGGVLLKFSGPFYLKNDSFLPKIDLVITLASQGLHGLTSDLAGLFLMDSARTLLFGGVLPKLFGPFWAKNNDILLRTLDLDIFWLEQYISVHGY